MTSSSSDKQRVYRDILATMLNKRQPTNWDELIKFAPVFHVDLEDEEMFGIQLNERIMRAAVSLKNEGEAMPHKFEELATLIASKIPELIKT